MTSQTAREVFVLDTIDILTNVLRFLIEMFTFGLILVVFWVIGIAVASMARNRSPRWDMILATLVILALGVGLVQVYPPQVMKSVRRGLEASRPEAVLLRDELGNWMPRWNATDPDPLISTAVPTPTPLPATSTPAPVATLDVLVTDVPPTSTPMPPTAVPTLDPLLWNPMTPPPTPVGGGK